MTVSDIIDDAGYLLNRLFSQLRVDRQRKHFFRGLLSDREIPLFMSKKTDCFLEMQRDRIIHDRGDIFFTQGLLYLVPLRAPERILVVYMLHIRSRHRPQDALGEEFVIECRPPSASLIILVDALEFDEKYTCLNFIKPAVKADSLMPVSAL